MKFTIYIYVSDIPDFLAGKEILYRNNQFMTDNIGIEITDRKLFEFRNVRSLNYVRLTP